VLLGPAWTWAPGLLFQSCPSACRWRDACCLLVLAVAELETGVAAAVAIAVAVVTLALGVLDCGRKTFPSARACRLLHGLELWCLPAKRPLLYPRLPWLLPWLAFSQNCGVTSVRLVAQALPAWGAHSLRCPVFSMLHDAQDRGRGSTLFSVAGWGCF
jgi:hypothetical protein